LRAAKSGLLVQHKPRITSGNFLCDDRRVYHTWNESHRHVDPYAFAFLVVDQPLLRLHENVRDEAHVDVRVPSFGIYVDTISALFDMLQNY